MKRVIEQQQVAADQILTKLPALKKVSVTLSSADFIADKSLAVTRLCNQMADEIVQQSYYRSFRSVEGGITFSGYIAVF